MTARGGTHLILTTCVPPKPLHTGLAPTPKLPRENLHSPDTPFLPLFPFILYCQPPLVKACRTRSTPNSVFTILPIAPSQSMQERANPQEHLCYMPTATGQSSQDMVNLTPNGVTGDEGRCAYHLCNEVHKLLPPVWEAIDAVGFCSSA